MNQFPLFTIIPTAQAIVRKKGVYRQCDVYRRGDEMYCKVGSGFIRILQQGTTQPDTTFIGCCLPDDVVFFKGCLIDKMSSSPLYQPQPVDDGVHF